MCTAAGHAVLKVIEKENLQENAHVVGSYLKERLNSLKDKHESKVSFPFPCITIKRTSFCASLQEILAS